ncbi:MAG: fructose-bisphosphate aldolase [Chromatiales bacterium 21-64-14]|nr:MAG: fructose-bisphosphate aldolase [Chromatiales bacterium 21-64-14]HQU15326.1 class II fructose-bisphosphate aldolase [Gammaproteobacteria bacterium]
MPLVDMRDMLNHAYRNGYAVGSFNLVSLDFLGAIVAAAENCRSPVILGLSELHTAHYDLELLIAATERAARRAAVPVSILLDHGMSPESAVRAINLGCNGVMVDGSQDSFPANVALTRAVADAAHACGVAVEGEIGNVAGIDGGAVDRDSGDVNYTLVEEAKAYVARTGVDFLAVSIGTIHGRIRGRPKLDFERLRRINDAVRLPLVIHGGTGLSDEQFHKLITHGVAKINYYTALSDAAGNAMRASARADTRCGYTGLTQGVGVAIRTEVERCMRVWGSAGRAAEVLMQCQPWHTIEHVIIFNVEGADDTDVEAIMSEGREVLAAIPGVRRVFTGWAVEDAPAYRFCWLVQFTHAKVIDSYREHPGYAAFAAGIFQPITARPISIDFAEVSEAPQRRGIRMPESLQA